MKIFKCKTEKIKVSEIRYRKDLGDIDSLAKSFLRTRQILPIIVNKDFELVDGQRRLEACKINEQEVLCVMQGTEDLFEMRELELEANFYRKDFTPAEKACAVRDLHELKKKRHGEAGSGREGGWALKKTAELLGVSKASVISDIQTAEIIDVFPALGAAKTTQEIKKAVKGLTKLTNAVKGLKNYEEASKGEVWKLYKGDAFEYMKEISDESIDILFTDPLYGIDHDALRYDKNLKIKDAIKGNLKQYATLATESFRFTVENAHGFIFVGPEYFWTLRQIYLEIGWRVHVKPLIWTKAETGQCNVPTAWPASCYEMIMYIRKDKSRFIKEGQPDWLQVNPTKPSEKIHDYEKPLTLLERLIQRVALPGQKLFDPFAGSCAILEAGINYKLIVSGCEIDSEAYALGLERLSKKVKN